MVMTTTTPLPHPPIANSSTPGSTTTRHAAALRPLSILDPQLLLLRPN